MSFPSLKLGSLSLVHSPSICAGCRSCLRWRGVSFRTDPRVSFSISFFTSLIITYITDSKTATRGLTKPGGGLFLPPTPAPNPSTSNTAQTPKPNISNPNCKPTQRTTPSSKTPSPKRIYSHTTSCICEYGGCCVDGLRGVYEGAGGGGGHFRWRGNGVRREDHDAPH